MAGTQTNGFDMVIEISTQTIQNLLSATFDNNGLLGSLIPSSVGTLQEFGLEVSFTRPSGIIATATNPIQLLFNIVLSNGLTGTLDVVVGMDVDRTDPNFDKVILAFTNKLYRCQLSVPGISTLITGPASTLIQNQLDNNDIPLMPIPVNRTSSSSTSINRADVKVIDDSSAANNDSLGIILTYGGGATGNINAFTNSFSRQGAGAAVAINFAWICRNISPRVESGIGLPAGSFAGCNFNGNFEIRDGVKLTHLSASAADDHIVLNGRVAKSGTCYEASGSFQARIFVSIVGGELRVRFETDNPDIDIDIPWYCWLGAAVLGAILGGVIFGVVGAIVGAIIIPLLLWIAQSVIESTIENVAGQVTTAINGIDDINIQLVGIDTILDRAFIDDLTVTYNMHEKEYWPIQSEGTVTLHSGDYFDLDTGIVKNEIFGGADLRLEGNLQSRSIKVLCGSSCAPLNLAKSFNQIRRYNLQMLHYGQSNVLPLYNFAHYVPIPFTSDDYFETFAIFAIKTSDNAYGIFQAISVDENKFVLQYKTYKSNVYTIDFTGSFKCPPYFHFDEHLQLQELTYVDARKVNSKLTETLSEELKAHTRLQASKLFVAEPVKLNSPKTAAVSKEQVGLMAKLDIMEQTIMSDALHMNQEKILQSNKAVGNWLGNYIMVREQKTASFVAKVNATVAVSSYTWSIDNIALAQNSTGTIKVKNQDFEYTTNGKSLTLSSNANVEIEVPIKLIITFANGHTDYIIKCIPYKNNCRYIKREIPVIADYFEKFDREYGVVML